MNDNTESSVIITSEPVDRRLATLAELDRQIAARAAVLEAQAGSDRAKFLRLLRSDRALEELKLEHDIGYQLLPEALRAGQREYLDEASMKRLDLKYLGEAQKRFGLKASLKGRR